MADGIEDAVTEVVIIDGHYLFRTGLARYLSLAGDLHVVAHAVSGSAGLGLVRQLHPHVVVLDQDLPDIEVADIVSIASRSAHAPRVVVLNTSVTASAVTEALKAGASAYLGKGSDVEDVAAAVRAAAAGSCWLSAEAAKVVSSQLREAPPRRPPADSAERLSTRELEVLKLLATGLDNSEIASALAITPSTVKNHVSNILTKLEVSNRILAAIYAVRHGLA